MRKVTIDLLVSHQRLIADVARKTALKLNYHDPEELESYGREQLVIKASKWNPERGAFSTFATWVLRNAMMDYVARNRRLVPMSEVSAEDGDPVNWIEAQPDTAAPAPQPSFMQELYETVGDSAREVLNVLASVDIQDVLGGRSLPIERLRKILMERGWDRRRTHQAFRELGMAVRGN